MSEKVGFWRKTGRFLKKQWQSWLGPFIGNTIQNTAEEALRAEIEEKLNGDSKTGKKIKRYENSARHRRFR